MYPLSTNIPDALAEIDETIGYIEISGSGMYIYMYELQYSSSHITIDINSNREPTLNEADHHQPIAIHQTKLLYSTLTARWQ